jgi:hypothetical protein
MGRLDLGIFHWLPGAAAAACTGAASARRETAAFANECAMRSCVHERRVLRRSRSCPVNLCELCGASTPSGVPPHKNSGEHVVWYLIINLDFDVRRLVAARVRRVAAARRALLRTNIGRLPSNTQARARDAADDVPPKSPSQVDVQKTGEPLVEPQPYR